MAIRPDAGVVVSRGENGKASGGECNESQSSIQTFALLES